MHLNIKRLLRFKKAYQSLAELAEHENWSRVKIETYQLKRLNELWGHATCHVDYYCEKAKAENLPSSFESLDHFRSTVPILPKSAYPYNAT